MTFNHEQRVHGFYGGEIITDTNPHSGQWFAFQVLAEAVLTKSIAAGVTNESGRAGLTLAEGTTHFGDFTTLQLASGVIQAFNTQP